MQEPTVDDFNNPTFWNRKSAIALSFPSYPTCIETIPMTTRLSAIAFTSDIARLTENFTGRQWVFDDIDRWLKESEERFFILTGEPGVGKSAIAALLTQISNELNYRGK